MKDKLEIKYRTRIFKEIWNISLAKDSRINGHPMIQDQENDKNVNELPNWFDEKKFNTQNNSFTVWKNEKFSLTEKNISNQLFSSFLV